MHGCQLQTTEHRVQLEQAEHISCASSKTLKSSDRGCGLVHTADPAQRKGGTVPEQPQQQQGPVERLLTLTSSICCSVISKSGKSGSGKYLQNNMGRRHSVECTRTHSPSLCISLTLLPWLQRCIIDTLQCEFQRGHEGQVGPPQSLWNMQCAGGLVG
jgi:hypothetical protein